MMVKTKKYRLQVSDFLRSISETLRRPELMATIISDTTILGDLIEDFELSEILDHPRSNVTLDSIVWEIAVRKKCLGIIPNTFYICGEDNQYCSDSCLDVEDIPN